MWLKHVKTIINHPAIPPKVVTTHTAASRSAKGDRQPGAITVPWGDVSDIGGTKKLKWRFKC